jgi:hypothetical protein
VARALLEELAARTQEQHPDGFTAVYLRHIADMTDVSYSHTLKIIRRFGESGLLERSTSRPWSPAVKHPLSTTSIRLRVDPATFLDRARTVSPTKGAASPTDHDDLHNQLGWGRDKREEKENMEQGRPPTRVDEDAASPTDARPDEAHSEEDETSFLVALAGDMPFHGRMQERGKDKYRSQKGQVTAKLAERHLAGEITLSASLLRKDGMTRAVCWDADNPEDWELLERAARCLRQSGAWAILESSPSSQHRGGGHLWLVFSAPVEAGDVFATADAIAPELCIIHERWPGVRTTIRLPGGYYRWQSDTPGDEGDTLVDDGDTPIGEVAIITEELSYTGERWCECSVVGADDSGWYTGRAAIATMMEHQSDPSWITERGSSAAQRSRQDVSAAVQLDPTPVDPDAPRPLPAAADDGVWQNKYGTSQKGRWFWFGPTQVAAYFNATHPVGTLLPADGSGMALATWRDEKNPSVKLYPATNSWCDFGMRIRGRFDGGDALELQCRMTRERRSTVFAKAAQDMKRAAEKELERAADHGEGPARWVADILSPQGWDHFDKLRGVARRSDAA